MKEIAISLVLFISLLFFPIPVYAQEAENNQPEIQYTNEFSVQNEPSSIIVLIKDFINGFDSFLGGFIFYTPDPFAETIKLKDDSTITGVTKYRNIFQQISIPILAIIIAVFAVTKIGNDNAYELKNFGLRFLIVIVLFVTTPLLLSYSIQFNNLLVNEILPTHEFTGFLNDYFDKSQESIANHENPERFGIPSFDIALQDGIFRSLGKFIVQIFLFLITFIFLLCGFLYLGYQFVIRFATLLFLGVIYPVVLPLALTEKTQNIVQTYFKTWFTFLIQQPSFALGFAITADIFDSILKSQGPSVGMLFFYTGFLFFLGGVNVLVAKIFGDTWSAISGSMLANISTRSTSAPIKSSLKSLGKNISYKNFNKSFDNKGSNNFVSADSKGRNEIKEYNSLSKEDFNSLRHKPSPLSAFSTSLTQKGFQVDQENIGQGIVSISGSAYKYEDGKNGLSVYYPTLNEAMQDGIAEDKLKKIDLNNQSFIDLSLFNKSNPNPHNFNAMEESRKRGKELNFAHINRSSPPNKIKNFLEVSQNRNDAFGINGVIAERQAKDGSNSIVRIYSHKNYEKRKNI
jgi:hypothetical protein